MKIIFLLLLIGLGFIGYISENTANSLAYFPPPLKQTASGIAPENVTCAEGLQIIIKKSSGIPACVKPNSVAALIERGWGIHVLPDYIKDKNNNSEIFDDGSYSISTKNVNYSGNFVGFLALPKDPGSYPGIVMIHEWWGLNDNIRQMAKHMASHGYIVLAVDLYGKEPATTTDEARQLMSSYNLEGGVTNMNDAVNFLLENYQVNNLGSIGWCFGGGQSLNLALNNDNLNATVIYYGQLTTDESQLSSIKWPVLGIFAGLDQGIPVETINEFETSLNNLGIENEIYIYPGVNHAFANPSGMSYAPEETKNAWEKTITFLEEHLK